MRAGVLRDDRGSAVVEFVGLGLLLLVPLVYLVLAAFEVQRNVFAATQAARQAGRAVATADTLDDGLARARYAAQLAMRDQGLEGGETVGYVPAPSSCDGAGEGVGAATLEPGAEFAVCVRRVAQMPGVPGFLAGDGVTVVGRHVVRVDRFRSTGLTAGA